MSCNKKKKIPAQIRVINFNPKLPNIAVAAGGDQIKLVEFTSDSGFDGKSPILRHAIGTSTLPNKFTISAAKFNPLDETELAIGTLSGHILVFDINKEIKQAKYTSVNTKKDSENCKIYSIDWGYGVGKNTAVIYVVSSDGKLNVHCPSENRVIPFSSFGEPSELMLNNGSKISSVSWKFSLDSVAIGYTTGRMEIYSRGSESAKLISKHAINSLGSQINCIEWLTGNLIAVSTDGNDVHVIDVEKGNVIYKLIGHKHRVTSISVSPAFNQVITSSCDETVALVYQLQPDTVPGATLKPSIIINHDDIRLFAVSLAPFSGNVAVSGGSDGRFNVWKLDEQPKATAEQLCELLGYEIEDQDFPQFTESGRQDDEDRKIDEIIKKLMANSTYPMIEEAVSHQKTKSGGVTKNVKDTNSSMIDEENMLYQ